MNIKNDLILFYLDWVNNWLSPESMAEYYGINTKQCIELIEIGRELYDSQIQGNSVKNSDN